MVAYAAWLVWRSIFETVTLSFLIAGHSKFSPDRFFGTLARKTSQHNGYTIFDVQHQANEICNVTGEVLQAEDFRDHRVFFETNFRLKIDHISKMHHIRVFRKQLGEPLSKLPHC